MTDQGYTQTISTDDFNETPSVVLEQPTGDVHVEGWDKPEIEVSITEEGIFEIEQTGSQIVIRNRPGRFKLVDFLEPATEDLRDLGIDLSKVASRVERSVERRMKDVKKMGRNINFDIDLSNWRGGRDYNIKVPHNCDLRLRTSSGDIVIAGVNGTLDLQSSSGDIRVREIGGNALIASSSGDLGIENLNGRLAVRTASGDIITHNLVVSEVSAATASGDLDLDLTRMPEGNVEVRTVSGDLDLFLPADAAFRAEVHTISGSVRCGFPREAVQYNSSHKRETVLNVNGGGKNLQLNTVSGDVTIRVHKGDGESKWQNTSQSYSRSASQSANWSAGSPTIRTGGQPTMDLSRTQTQSQSGDADGGGSSGDITQSESQAARQQAELEILQQVERGELTPEDALERLSALDGQ